MTYLERLAAWEVLVAQVAELKAKLKPLAEAELEMRQELVAAFTGLKEGTNTFTLPDARIMKVVYKIERKIDESNVDNARAAFMALNDRAVDFDVLLRVKYELSKRSWDLLDAAGKLAVSPMIIAKPQAPEVTIK